MIFFLPPYHPVGRFKSCILSAIVTFGLRPLRASGFLPESVPVRLTVLGRSVSTYPSVIHTSRLFPRPIDDDVASLTSVCLPIMDFGR